MQAYERLIRYARIHTTSDKNADTTPSTARQFDLSQLLAGEMTAMGFLDVMVDEHAYTYGIVPASEGCEDWPSVGLIAHLDTAPDFSGEGVKPRLVPDYDGKDLPIGPRVLSPEQFPDLKKLIGHTLITTDGNTLLGADDKAGIAEILTACEEIMKENLPHGRLAVCFVYAFVHAISFPVAATVMLLSVAFCVQSYPVTFQLSVCSLAATVAPTATSSIVHV